MHFCIWDQWGCFIYFSSFGRGLLDYPHCIHEFPLISSPFYIVFNHHFVCRLHPDIAASACGLQKTLSPVRQHIASPCVFLRAPEHSKDTTCRIRRAVTRLLATQQFTTWKTTGFTSRQIIQLSGHGLTQLEQTWNWRHNLSDPITFFCVLPSSESYHLDMEIHHL